MNLLDQSIDSVKRISWELTPEAFQHSGFSSSIREMCHRLDGKGQSMTCQETGVVTFWRDDRALTVFRIVQELVNNAVKHSQGDSIKVLSQWAPQELIITVEDNGIGFTLDDRERKGVGWWNIRHRADRVNATVAINPVQRGSLVQINVPFPA